MASACNKVLTRTSLHERLAPKGLVIYLENQP